jgi:serine/threonine protein kinase
LKQELDCLEQLNHPNVVKVLELLEDDDNIYCVMELLETGNLL